MPEIWRPTPWIDTPFDLGGMMVQPPTGCDPYNGVMTVGQEGTNVGVDVGPPNPHGSMNPPNINGLQIYNFLFFGGDLGAGVLTMTATNQEIPTGGGRNLLITIGTDIEREWTWNAGNGDYTINGALALENYLEANVGNQLPVCINWGSGGEPEEP